MKSVLRDKNWSQKIDWVNFQYNSIHMLLWNFLFFPHKQVVGSAECGKLFYMIDGLNFSIKSIFAGLRKSLGWRRRESSVWRRKPSFLCLLASPFLFKFTHYLTKRTRHHSTLLLGEGVTPSSSPEQHPQHPAKDMGKWSVNWKFCHRWLTSGATVTQGLNALLFLILSVTHLSHHSLRACLGRNTLREAVCRYRSEHFSKV